MGIPPIYVDDQADGLHLPVDRVGGDDEPQPAAVDVPPVADLPPERLELPPGKIGRASPQIRWGKAYRFVTLSRNDLDLDVRRTHRQNWISTIGSPTGFDRRFSRRSSSARHHPLRLPRDVSGAARTHAIKWTRVILPSRHRRRSVPWRHGRKR